MIIYHGSSEKINNPFIKKSKYNKDFSFGFYCTLLKEQAERWACRHGNVGVVNEYEYENNEKLSVKKYDEMSEEWLDFIVDCRSGKTHNYDIVEGPMANDVIFNYIQDYIDGNITREAFWALAKFKKPTHQICFCTNGALKTIKFINSYEVKVNDKNRQ